MAATVTRVYICLYIKRERETEMHTTHTTTLTQSCNIPYMLVSYLQTPHGHLIPSNYKKNIKTILSFRCFTFFKSKTI